MRPGNLRRGGGAPSHGGRTVGSRRPPRETRAIRCSETQSSPRTGLGREKSLNLNRGLAIKVDFRVESAPLRRCWGSWGGPARNQPLSCLSGTVQTLAEHRSPGSGRLLSLPVTNWRSEPRQAQPSVAGLDLLGTLGVGATDRWTQQERPRHPRPRPYQRLRGRRRVLGALASRHGG